MRVLLAGATGALGRRLLPMLVEAGYEVTGTTTSTQKVAVIEATGARAAVMNGLDRESVLEAMDAARPDVVVHQLTALAGRGNLRKFDKEFTTTNRLRTIGTDHLLAAAHEVGAKRLVAQSFTGWTNARTGGKVKDETDPLDPHPPAGARETLAAIEYVEKEVPSAGGLDGLVLRYGGFYGPGTGLGAGGDLLGMVRTRRLPLVGDGAGVWSLVHIDDAARATVCAVEHGGPGLYNIVDDEPAPMSQWLPYLAAAVGAKPPLRLPVWLARPLVGEHGISLTTQIRGSSNAKARRELGWELRYPTWREGFRTALG